MASKTNIEVSGEGYLGDLKDTREFQTKNGRQMIVKRFLLKTYKPKWERDKLGEEGNPYVFMDIDILGLKDSKLWLSIVPGAKIMYKNGELRLWERNDGGYGLDIEANIRDVMCDDRFSNNNNKEGMTVNVGEDGDDLPPF